MKTPKCKICGGPHYKYQCFQNPKRKQALKRKYSEYKKGKVPKREKLLASQTNPRKRLILELDRYCSLCVRIEASDKFGIASCFTCGKRYPYKMMDNGHYRSRQFGGTRFDFDNMRPQCQNCNRLLHGNLSRYRENLIREIGEERVDALDLKKNNKISTVELENLLVEIKNRYKNDIEKKKVEQRTSGLV